MAAVAGCSEWWEASAVMMPPSWSRGQLESDRRSHSSVVVWSCLPNRHEQLFHRLAAHVEHLFRVLPIELHRRLADTRVRVMPSEDATASQRFDDLATCRLMQTRQCAHLLSSKHVQTPTSTIDCYKHAIKSRLSDNNMYQMLT